MHFTKLSKSQYLFQVQVLFANSISDKEIRDAVCNFGYNEQRIAEGKRLYDELGAIETEHLVKTGEKVGLYNRKKEKHKELSRSYMKYLKIARIAFVSNIEAREALLLDGVRERTYKKWVFQVSVFCNNLLDNSEYWPDLEQYGVTKDHIVKLKKDLLELMDLSDKGAKVTGLVKMLTQKKKKQTQKVQDWVSDYIKIARIALEDTPQSLEKLGIVVKN
ncbi:MAG: hypothetical protein JXB17_11145 [Bacteroidales bacterium]|nr:hypothetical protein [Bacteroidales bacterium]